MTLESLLLLWVLCLALTLTRLTFFSGRWLLVYSTVLSGVIFSCYPWVARISLVKLLDIANRPEYFDGIQLLMMAEAGFSFLLFFLTHPGPRNPETGKQKFFAWIPSPLFFLTSFLLMASVFYYQSILSLQLGAFLFSTAIGFVIFTATLLLKKSGFRLTHPATAALAGALILTTVLIQGSRPALPPVSSDNSLIPFLILSGLVTLLLLLGSGIQSYRRAERSNPD